MNELTVFNFENEDIRTIIIDNNIWFIAKDITKILGYINGKQAIIEHCDGVYKKYPIVDRLGRKQEASIIDESGLYKLVLASKLPNAIKFKNWVTSQVLPSIRKTGSYSVNQKPELSIEQMTLMVIQNLQSKISEQQKQLEEQKPKVEFAEKISNTENAISVGEFAKVLKIGQNKLFDWLRQNKYLMNNNIPYQRYVELGYFKVIEWVLDAKNQVKFKTLITGKGQMYLTDKIK